jgi:hypothetical protein
MVPLPNLLAKFVNDLGRIIPPWNSYLQQFTQAPPNFMAQTVSGSPFSFTATEPGMIAISGGTVIAVTLTRGATVINLGATPKLIPVAIADTVTITYSVLPTISFIPSFGQNTNT